MPGAADTACPSAEFWPMRLNAGLSVPSNARSNCSNETEDHVVYSGSCRSKVQDRAGEHGGSEPASRCQGQRVCSTSCSKQIVTEHTQPAALPSGERQLAAAYLTHGCTVIAFSSSDKVSNTCQR